MIWTRAGIVISEHRSLSEREGWGKGGGRGVGDWLLVLYFDL